MKESTTEDKRALNDAKVALKQLSKSWTGVDDFFSSLDKVYRYWMTILNFKYANNYVYMLMIIS